MNEKDGDELLKRLWQMPPKPHARIKPKAKKKAGKKKKPAKKGSPKSGRRSRADHD